MSDESDHFLCPSFLFVPKEREREGKDYLKARNGLFIVDEVANSSESGGAKGGSELLSLSLSFHFLEVRGVRIGCV